MIRGLIILKAEPISLGHEALINFAKEKCDLLYVLLCMNDEKETIPGYVRLHWLTDKYRDDYKVIIRYTDVKLPYTSVSDREVSKLWADHISKTLDNVDVVFASEPYAEYVAEYMNCGYVIFDEKRETVPISGTQIRENPFKYWDYISLVARPYFVKKICLCGTESTGKTVLTEKLSKVFQTSYVKEWGRDIIEHSDNTTIKDIMNVGKAHASGIIEEIKHANRILFSDTNLNTTKSYSKFFFDLEPVFDNWIEEANKFDLYIFLDKDAPYIQDGTRLSKEKRDDLGDFQYNFFKSKNLKMEVVSGTDWEERTQKAIDIVKKNFFNY